VSRPLSLNPDAIVSGSVQDFVAYHLVRNNPEHAMRPPTGLGSLVAKPMTSVSAVRVAAGRGGEKDQGADA